MVKRALFLFAVALAPATAATREATNDTCRSCHTDITAKHDSALHAHSFDDASFQKGYRKEPEAYCRACHEPEPAFATQRGVACVTCHDPESRGTVLTTTASGKAPHKVDSQADFGTQACARCHEFPFPHAENNGEKGLMQKTMHEHAGDARSCSSCHLRDHTFNVSRDPAMLARALVVTASRDDEQQAVFELSSRGIGHAFPTGDLFRRLVLRVSKAGGKPVEVPFWRTFRSHRNEDGTLARAESSDRRLAPSQRVVIPMAAELSWEVAYQRITSVEQTPPFGVDVEAETILARGRLP